MGLLDYMRANGLLGAPQTAEEQQARLAAESGRSERWLAARKLDIKPKMPTREVLLNTLSMIPNPIGDIASGVQAYDFANKGEYGNAALAGVGVLPFVPGLAGMIKKTTSGAEDVVLAYKASLRDDPNAIYGLRVIPHGMNTKKGAFLENSRVWDSDGNMTDEMLPGVSTVGIEKGDVSAAIKSMKKGGYYGDQMAIVKGDSAGYGQDDFERLIKDPEVVDVFNYDFKTRNIGDSPGLLGKPKK